MERNEKHSITKDDLMHAIKRECLSSLDEVEEAYFETDGKISVVKKK